MRIFTENRKFFFLWIGQFVSSCGGWINYVALNVLLYELTGSGKTLGLFFAVRMLPSLFFGAVGGYLADRFDKRKLMIMCDTVRAVSVLTFIVTKDINIFFIVAFCLSAFDKIYSSCSGSIIPELVKKEDLMKANSYLRVSQSVTTIAGPAVGGFLIGLWGYRNAFIADSCTFIFSVITLLLISEYVRTEASTQKKHSIYLEFKETFVFMFSSGAIFYYMILRLFDGLGSGTYNTVMPVFSASIPSEAPIFTSGSFYAWLLASWGIGTLIGALCTSALNKKIKTTALYCGATLIMAIGMGGTFLVPHSFYFFPPCLLCFLSIAIGGFGDGISGVVFNTLLMEKTPRELMGKVFGTVASTIYMICGLGMYIAGICLDIADLKTIIIGGTALIISAVILIWTASEAIGRRIKTS